MEQINQTVLKVVSTIKSGKAHSTVLNPKYSSVDASKLGKYFLDIINTETGKQPQWTNSIVSAGKQIAKWLQSPERKEWLYLGGKVGAGKTTMMRAIALCLKDVDGVEPYFTTADKFSHLPDKEQQKITDAKAMILMDDVGAEASQMKDYGTEITPFATFITTRYTRCYDLFTLNIFSTNLTLGEIEARYGTRVADRLFERCEIVDFTDDSFRTND